MPSRCVIPLFFFHLRDGRKLSPDETGTEFLDIYAAYLDACRAVDEIWIEMATDVASMGRHSFEITDAFGRYLIQLPFSEVLLTPTKMTRDRRKRVSIAADTTQKSRILAAEIATLVVTAARTVERTRSVLLRARRDYPTPSFENPARG